MLITFITYFLRSYSKIDQNIIINARILDNRTGKIVSSARAMYANDDCSIFGVCNNAQRKIKIVADKCLSTKKELNTNKERLN